MQLKNSLKYLAISLRMKIKRITFDTIKSETNMKKQVKDLKAGDNLGNCTILSTQYIGNYCGSKNKAYVNVRFNDGKESTRVWGWNTTVTVIS